MLIEYEGVANIFIENIQEKVTFWHFLECHTIFEHDLLLIPFISLAFAKA